MILVQTLPSLELMASIFECGHHPAKALLIPESVASVLVNAGLDVEPIRGSLIVACRFCMHVHRYYELQLTQLVHLYRNPRPDIKVVEEWSFNDGRFRRMVERIMNEDTW